jgi:hypothetical protein
MTPQIETGSKNVRGMAQRSIEMIEAMYDIAETCQPITGRGIGYKLFTGRMTASMKRPVMQRVYRLLREARERQIIPWPWIVDETRELEQTPSWRDPKEFARAAIRQYRRDHWDQQPSRVELWSEKGTVRGVLAPVLEQYGVGFRVMHGFCGATSIHDIAQDDDGRPLFALYCGDYDPSGLCMSEQDLPSRLDKYGGGHVILKRIALIKSDLLNLPSFAAADKKKDPRHDWFVENFGDRCWELDAMDPNDLRDRVEAEIVARIFDQDAWNRCKTVEAAEGDSLREVLEAWAGAR